MESNSSLNPILDLRAAKFAYAEKFQGVPHVLPWWIEDAAEIRRRTESGVPWTKADQPKLDAHGNEIC